MAVKVAPFKTSRKVAPYPSDRSFVLGSDELEIFDSVTSEQNRIGGTEIELYQYDLKKSVRDPVYGEPSYEAWKKPVRLKAWFQYPDIEEQATSDGSMSTWPSIFWVGRKDLEDVHAEIPGIGEIIKVWNIPYFILEKSSTDDPERAFYFAIKSVAEDSHMFDNAQFTAYRLTVERRTTFAPERRLLNT